MADSVRILIADDQVLFAESLKTVLETDVPGFQVVGIANNGLEAIDFASKLIPDIILMDASMPILDGASAARQIIGKYSQIRIIMLTGFDDDDLVNRSIQYGVMGYLLKDIRPDELVTAIQTVMAGKTFLQPQSMEEIADRHGTQILRPVHEKALHTPIDGLTRREKEILDLLVKGYSNAEISAKLYLGQQTVKNYVSMIYTKLGANNRLQAMKIALDCQVYSSIGVPAPEKY